MEEVKNRERQRIRVMSYFVRAALEVMKEEGIEYLTVRKVSQKAGYNQATLYNYFENLDYLIAFASIRYLYDYHISLTTDVDQIEDDELRFFAIWERFCYYSFKEPKVYQALFFLSPKYTICELLDSYYKMFPEEKNHYPFAVERMMRGCTLEDRNLITLLAALDSKGRNLPMDEIRKMNRLMVLMYRGKLSQVIQEKPDEAGIQNATDEVLTFLDLIYRIGK